MKIDWNSNISVERRKGPLVSNLTSRSVYYPAKPSLDSLGVSHNYTGVLTLLNKVEFRMAIPTLTRKYTPGSCRNSRNRMRHPPHWEMRLDSPALHAEQSRFPNQTRKEPRFS